MTPSNNSNWLPTASNPRSAVGAAAAMIGICVLARLLPHPPNVSPVASLAVFGGAFFATKRMAIAVPLLAMLVSDLVLGFHGAMVAVYASLAISVLIGRHVRRRPNLRRIAGATLASSIVFFVLSNLAVWMMWYPTTLSGLTTCFAAAVPFFQNSLVGNAFFSSVVFGSAAMMQSRDKFARRIPARAHVA